MKFKIKKSYYRLFSVLLSVVMIVLSVPISAFADGGDGTVPTIPPITEGDTVTPEPIDPPPDDDGGADAGTDGVVVPPIPDDPDPDPTYLEDGVYTIRNIGNSGMYMDTNADSPFANSYMQQTRYTSSPVTSTSIGAFFKITRRSNNLYVIRLMTNNCLTFASSNGDVKTVEISPNDSSVASSQLFAITAYENGYRIKSNADNKLIVAPSGSASGDSNVAARLDSVSSVTDGRDKWIFTKYTGSSFTNVTINECPTKMITGQTATVNAYVSSTLVGRNGPIEYSVTETNYLDTNKATIDETSGALTANSVGTVYVWATCSGTSYETHKTVSIEENLEGTYFFNNVEYDDKFMQINNNASPSENGAFMELWDFDGEDYQKWSLVHVGDWYYKIVSVASGKALTVPSSADESVTQTTYTGAANQHWLFSKNSDGSYTVRSQNYYLAAGDGIFTSDGRNVEGRTAQSDGKDEWKLNPYAVTLYGITNVNHDHISSLREIQDELSSKKYNDITVRDGSISVNLCKNELKETNIFSIRSHGLKVVSPYNTVLATGILLNDELDSSGYVNNYSAVLYSNYIGNTNSYSSTLSYADDFSNIDIALFVACNTGAGDVGALNLPSVVVENGARVAIGFLEEIACDQANIWIETFYEKMLAGNTVGMACAEANEASEIDCLVVCGDDSVRLPRT